MTDDRSARDCDPGGSNMSLKSELAAAKSQSFNSAKWGEIEDCLRDLLENHGDIESKWCVVRTAFHGGGVVSTHRTATAAILKARSYRSDCTCGCCDVVRADQVASLKFASDCRSPYQAAR